MDFASNSVLARDGDSSNKRKQKSKFLFGPTIESGGNGVNDQVTAFNWIIPNPEIFEFLCFRRSDSIILIFIAFVHHLHTVNVDSQLQLGSGVGEGRKHPPLDQYPVDFSIVSWQQRFYKIVFENEHHCSGHMTWFKRSEQFLHSCFLVVTEN